MRGHGAAGGRDDVSVYRGVVESETLRLFVGEFGNIACIGVAVAHPERDVRVAVGTADVLVEERFRHEFRDARMAFVGE